MSELLYPYSGRLIYQASICVLFLLVVVLCGCRRSATSQEESTAGVVAAQHYREELVSYAIDNLNRLEEFTGGELLQQIIARLDPQQPKKDERRLDPLADCWPLPEMLRQVIERLNQWLRAQPAATDWQPDPLINDLPSDLREMSLMKELNRLELSRFEGFVLQETTWLRDIAQTACGELLDEVSRAESLFDWTVRNIQLEPDTPDRIPQFPWETLLFGRGTAAERAEVFILLLRQLHIEAALLAVVERPWCVGVLVEGEVYLFEPQLGVPIPAPNGLTLRAERGLHIRPATLSQVLADEKILPQLNLNENNQYEVKKEALEQPVAVLLLASPSSLSRRMELIQARLAGPQRMVLLARPSAQAERWRAAVKGAAVHLWQRPFRVLQQRSTLEPKQVQSRLAAMVPFFLGRNAPLYRGRILHLKGRLVGEEGALQYYQAARPSHAELAASSLETVEKTLLLRGKQDASYWCGLLTFQRGNYSAAIDYFARRTLLAYPDGPWTHGATYNLARAYEALGEFERAIAQYQGDDTAPDYYGRLLRARWLAETARKKQ